MSWMSRSRQIFPFSRYSVSPERNSRRVIVISPARTGDRPNFRRRTFSTTLLRPVLRFAASPGASVFFGLALSVSYVCARLCLDHSLFGLFGGLGAQRSFIPVAVCRSLARNSLAIDHDLGLALRERLAVVHLRIDQRQRHLRHAGRLAVARAGEDDVLHLDAAQALGRLLAEHPRDRVRDVRLAAAVRPDDGRNAFTGELHLGAIAEGLEAENLYFFELEQGRVPRTV